MNLISSSLFLSFATSQNNNEWGCNHFGTFPTDMCIAWTSTTAFRYTCNGTDSITRNEWSNFSNFDECGSEDPTSSYEYSLDGTWGNVAECDNTQSCGYFGILCNDVMTLILPMDVCYSFSSSSSYEFSCNGSEITYKLYSEGDCTGSSTTTRYDYADIYTNECYQVKNKKYINNCPIANFELTSVIWL